MASVPTFNNKTKNSLPHEQGKSAEHPKNSHPPASVIGSRFFPEACTELEAKLQPYPATGLLARCL